MKNRTVVRDFYTEPPWIGTRSHLLGTRSHLLGTRSHLLGTRSHLLGTESAPACHRLALSTVFCYTSRGLER